MKENHMTTGTTTFSTSDQVVVRKSFEPLPTGTYKMTLIGAQVEVRRSQGEDSAQLEYVNCRFAATGTGSGGKDRIVFHSFFLSLEPAKDGVIAPNRGGGLVEFANAVGSPMSDIEVKTDTDAKLKREVKVLNATQVADWLRQFNGAEVTARLKIDRQRGREPQNKIEYFEPA